LAELCAYELENRLLVHVDVLKKTTCPSGPAYQVKVLYDGELVVLPASFIHSGTTKDLSAPPKSPSEMRALLGLSRRGERGGRGRRLNLDEQGEGLADVSQDDSYYESSADELEGGRIPDEDIDVVEIEDEGSEDEDGTWTEGAQWQADPNGGARFDPRLQSSRHAQPPKPRDSSTLSWSLFAFLWLLSKVS
jgi:hypothetical protein